MHIALSLIIIIIIGFRPDNIGPDFSEYLNHFYHYKNIPLLEPSFKFISHIVHIIFNSQYVILFFIYAVIGCSLKFIAIRRLSEFVFLSTIIYISNYLMLHEVVQIRAGVASGFLLLSIKPLYERDRKKFLIFATCATLFHYSGIIVYALWFLKNNNYKIWWTFIPISFFIYFIGFSILQIFEYIYIPVISDKLEVYMRIKELDNENILNKINIFNPIYISKVIICYLLYWKASIISRYNKYFILLLKIFILSLAAMPLFSIIPVLAFRISELYGIVIIVLLPMFLYCIKPQLLCKFLIILYSLLELLLSIFYNKLIS